MFPTSLCGVLVFDSVSRAPHTHNTITSHTQTHTHNTHTQTTSHTHRQLHTHTHNTITSHTHTQTHTHTNNTRHSAWQAWHLVTFTFVSRGRRGTISHLLSFCVAGAALIALGGALGPGLGAPWSRVTPWHCAWQAWHNRTSMVVLRGRRLMALGGALGPGLGAPWSRVTPRHCAWQAWHNRTSMVVLRGRRGTIAHPWSFCVAGASLMALGGALGPGLGAPWSRVTPRHCAWQAWHNRTSMVVLRGRRGRIAHPWSFCVAGASLGTGWRPWARFRRALVARDAAALCVAGVAQSHIYGRFAWQAPHSWHWVAPLGPV